MRSGIINFTISICSMYISDWRQHMVIFSHSIFQIITGVDMSLSCPVFVLIHHMCFLKFIASSVIEANGSCTRFHLNIVLYNFFPGKFCSISKGWCKLSSWCMTALCFYQGLTADNKCCMYINVCFLCCKLMFFLRT
jgi:hypothetical protein